MATQAKEELKYSYVEHALKKNRLWETEHRTYDHAHKITARHRSFTACYKLPLNTTCITNLCFNGVSVYDFSGVRRRTAIIGGGGRFEMKRRYYDGQLVSVELILKDVCYYTAKKPVFRVVIEVAEGVV